MAHELTLSAAARARTRRPPVALALGAGTAAALAVGLAAATHAPETRISPIRPDSQLWRTLLVAGLLAAFVLYLLGLLAARRHALAVGAVAAVAVAIQLAPLATPMLLARDVYLY